MSAYQFIEPGAGFPGVSATYSTPQVRPGLIAGAVDATLGYAEFMYVCGQTASAPTAGDGCRIDGYSAQQLVSGNTGSRGPVGIVPAALSNTNVWGWAQVYGVCDYANMGTATTAQGSPIVVGTTAGRLQATAGATGYLINGLYMSNYTASSAQSNAATLALYYPVYDGRNQ